MDRNTRKRKIHMRQIFKIFLGQQQKPQKNRQKRMQKNNS